MGREVKRVALDFEWPLNQVWPGYLISFCIDDCDRCKKAAEIKSMKINSYDCPVWPDMGPPKGDGWQMWETTSEGSPISPVCKTPEELAKWLANNGASAFGSQTASYEHWLGMINAGWAPSAVADSGGLKSGVEAMSVLQHQTTRQPLQ